MNEGLEIIGDTAFTHSNITTIIIPSTVRYIGSHSFAVCKELESIEIPSSVTYLGESCFESCSKLKSVIIGKNISKIPKCAFLFCSNLNNAIILGEVTCFEQECFAFTKVTSFKFPQNTKCEYGSFKKNNIKMLDIGANTTITFPEFESTSINVILKDNNKFLFAFNYCYRPKIDFFGFLFK